MKPNIIYANAVITTYTKKLLTQHQQRRMMASATFADSARILFECGYNENVILHSGDNEDYIINHELGKTIALFKELCPSDALRSCFLAEYDYHNARVLYKSRFTDISVSEITYPSGNIEIKTLQEDISEQTYKNLPTIMAEALKTLDAMASPSSQDIDTILFNAMYAHINSCVADIKNKTVVDYFKSIDCFRKQDTEHYKCFQNSNASFFGLDFFFNWFILKKQELRTVKAILMGKNLGLKGKWWKQAN